MATILEISNIRENGSKKGKVIFNRRQCGGVEEKEGGTVKKRIVGLGRCGDGRVRRGGGGFWRGGGGFGAGLGVVRGKVDVVRGSGGKKQRP